MNRYDVKGRESLKTLNAAFRRGLKQIGNPTLAAVLELKYIDGGSWRAVARSMQYSVRHIYRLRDEAAERLRELERGDV